MKPAHAYARVPKEWADEVRNGAEVIYLYIKNGNEVLTKVSSLKQRSDKCAPSFSLHIFTKEPTDPFSAGHAAKTSLSTRTCAPQLWPSSTSKTRGVSLIIPIVSERIRK